MHRGKLSRRVFLAIFSTVTVLITLILVFQLVFMDEWYYNRKVDQMIIELDEIAGEIKAIDIEDTTLLEYEIYPLIEEYEETSGVILSSYYEYNIDYGYEELQTSEFYEINLLIEESQLMVYADTIPGEVFLDGYEANQEIKVSGYVEDGLFYPIWWDNVNVYEMEDLYFYDPILIETGELYSGEATVIQIDKDTIDPLESIDGLIEMMETDIYDPMIFFGDSEEVENVTSIEDGFYYYEYRQPFSDATTLMFIKEVRLDNGIVLNMSAQVSLQSMSEMVSFMIPFYILFYLVGLLLAVILSKSIAGRLTRPIIAMRDKTNQLSNMVFDQRVEYKGNDELGELADSINSLSDQLDQALTGLNEANKELLKDIEKERALEGVRKEFITNVSHELKTPLGIAKGYIEAILDGIRTDKQEDYLKITLNELDQINQIVINMLELMKMEEHKTLNLESRSIMPYLEELSEYFDMLITSKGLKIDLPETIKDVVIDERTFKTVMMNLLSNAIHYGINDGEILVETIEVGDCINILVINEVKYPEDIDLEKIWHKFYTIDQSRNRLSSGTGLGLSIVKSILDSYGSDYNVSLDGNRFIFSFMLERG